MRITDNMVTNSITSELQQLSAQQSTLQTEVSSGLSVTQPSDNPAAFGQVVELESQSRQLAQYGDNASRALSIVQSSYSGLSSLNQIYNRASELSALGTNGAQTTSDLQGYASELDQLIQQAVQVGNSQFGGEYLFAGTAVTQPPYTTTTNASGQITGVTYVGNSTQASVPLSATSSVAPSTSGVTNTGIASLVNTMIALRDAIQTGDTAGAATAATSLTSAEGVLTDAVAENGAVQARIQSDKTQQQAMATEISSQISTATSADLPTTIVKLNQSQLAYQAALETVSKVMQLSLIDYIH